METDRPDCGWNHRYTDKRAAQSAINLFRRRGRGRHGRPNALSCYACPHCQGWHLTKRKHW